MAFCTSCGATVEAGKKFCTACGATLPTAPAAAPAAPTAAAPAAAAPAPAAAQQPKQGGGALKIILIVLGIIFFFAILAIVGVVYVGVRAKKAIESAAVTTTSGGKTTVNTPWGKVGSSESQDPQEVLDKIGVEAYPGATPVEGSVHVATLGKLKTAAVKFTTSDAPTQVFDFYKGNHHDAMTAGSGDRYSIMFSGKDKALVTIGIHLMDGKTEIEIGSMTGGGQPSGGDENN